MLAKQAPSFPSRVTEVIEPQIRIRSVPDIEVIPPPIIIEPPITRELPWGLPVIDMPCAMTREKYSSGTSDYNIDPDGNLILCEGGAPAFFAPDLTPGIKVIPKELKVSDYVQENETNEKKAETPQIKIPEIPPRPPCPPPGSLPVGSIGKYGRGRILAYREDLITGKCVTEYEPIKVIETIDHFTPPPALVTGVMATALFGASAALLAAPLTEVIKKKSKPLQKKIIKFVKKKLNKKEKPTSTSEKRKAQREKRATDLMWRSLGKK